MCSFMPCTFRPASLMHAPLASANSDSHSRSCRHQSVRNFVPPLAGRRRERRPFIVQFAWLFAIRHTHTAAAFHCYALHHDQGMLRSIACLGKCPQRVCLSLLCSVLSKQAAGLSRPIGRALTSSCTTGLLHKV